MLLLQNMSLIHNMSLRAKRSNLLKEMPLFPVRLPRCARNDTEVARLQRCARNDNEKISNRFNLFCGQ